jgi:nucleoside-diphosphate-sugar epimerase
MVPFFDGNYYLTGTLLIPVLASLFILPLGIYFFQLGVNVGTGSDLTIKELAHSIKEVTGYTGSINFDSSKLDGSPQKLMDSSRLTKLGWKPEFDLKTGLAKAYENFLTRVP